MQHHLLPILLAVLLVGCDLSGNDEISGPAVAVPGCGPTDGPMLDVYVSSDDDITCDYHLWASPQRIAYLHVAIEGVSTFSVPSSYDLGEGVRVERCTAHLECVEAASGTVTFRKDGEMTTIAYDLVLPGGTVNRGSATIQQCPRTYQCG